MADRIRAFRLKDNYDYRLQCERCKVERKPYLAPMVSCACSSCWTKFEVPEFLLTWLRCCYSIWKNKGPMGRDKYVLDLTLNTRFSIVKEEFSLQDFLKALDSAKPWPDELLWDEFRDVFREAVLGAVNEESYVSVAL